MGEYLNYAGRDVLKMGTADDWRTLTRQEAEHFASHPMVSPDSRQNIRAALTDNWVLWRFPYLSEEEKNEAYIVVSNSPEDSTSKTDSGLPPITAHNSFSQSATKAVTTPFGKEIGENEVLVYNWDLIGSRERDLSRFHIESQEVLDMIEHDTIQVTLSSKGRGKKSLHHGYATNILMPCPHARDFTCKTSHTHAHIVINGMKRDVNGNEYTVFACGYCGTPFSISTELLETMRSNIFFGYYRYDEATKEEIRSYILANPSLLEDKELD